MQNDKSIKMNTQKMGSKYGMNSRFTAGTKKYNPWRKRKMSSKYEVRTSDGESHYYNGWWDYVVFRLKNRGNILYVRVNYF